tara:strand:- start:1401 stop:1535 length:135 start_codon:yes stop_codon:yes gene_type:complete
MSRAILLYTLFFVSHNNFGLDERQYGILRAIKDIENSKSVKLDN